MTLKPGSVAYRIVSMLQQMPAGASLSFRECADYTQCEAKKINTLCAVAVRDALLDRFHDGKCWRMRLGLEGRALNTGAAPESPAAEAPALEIGEPTEQPAEVAFDACRWLDGSLTIKGALISDAGEVFLPPEQSKALAQLFKAMESGNV